MRTDVLEKYRERKPYGREPWPLEALSVAVARNCPWVVFGLEKRLYIWSLDGIADGAVPVVVKDLDEPVGGLTITKRGFTHTGYPHSNFRRSAAR